ncbi:hypothetical protein [Streptomyces rapamycinicus]|uniref:Uncharacterized protein n=2 Tax=Streptomyces rapamycinicus TaxID=1226757 RepID=A0A0A0NB80_STRRN|nr:hypothetical protein [Streptomyces rapamycinicus]AGP56712.1 hypothetical protein M271_26150 [Streptomyces rapamycinicus NRRL 5491]MBB4784319.1 hypothetical protein [Streptomyces rapamycinicus]RLV80197.1 hypothetical protein D3C57_117470 [Streptomyces rapamycinicus NRRL 5491]UTO64640.1 hypothetical protein LJB45_21440 [Streptomyces rapamycinicus]UTP32596.1 hypothetical protein LIV37_26565 [Streptomyces rapamycinicus NRRL 5491]
MKSLLWLVLAIAAIVNVASSFAFDGVEQILVSSVTGLAAITTATALYLTRDRRTA